MAAETAPTLEFDFGPENGTRSFESVQHLDDWMHEEQEAWFWLRDARNLHQGIQQTWRVFGSGLSSVLKSIQQLDPEQPTEPDVRNLRRQIQQAYDQKGLILSDSPRGQFIFGLVENGETESAAWATSHWLNAGFPPGHPPALRGSTLAVLFDHGVSTDTANSEKRSLRAMRASWERVFADKRDEWADAWQKREDELKELRKKTEEYRTGLRRLLEMQAEDAGDQMEEAHDRLTTLERTYDEKLALRKPVEYWEGQAQHHGRRSVAYGIAAGVAGAVVIVGLSWLLNQLLGVGRTPEYWELGSLAVVVLISVWGLRILVRILLSHVHLKTDAAERAIMTQTYLALLREDRGLDQDDRAVILNTLFRPTPLGIIKDDAVPPSVWEILTRGGGGK